MAEPEHKSSNPSQVPSTGQDKGEIIDLKKLFKAPDEETHMDDITNPYSVRNWWNSIQAMDSDDYKERAKLYYRALYFLPGSYKLWHNFLEESIKNCKRYPLTSKRYDIITKLFEKCLIYMNKMPKIWLDYCKFMGRQKLVTLTRETYDRALLSLPLTQHDLVWDRYVFWARKLENLDLLKAVYTRFVKFTPSATEEFIDLLLDYGDVQGAVEMYIKILNDSAYSSKKGLSQYQLWMQLCELISKHPDKLDLPNAEKIIRHGIKKYTDEVGKLWISLADYNTRLGNFEKAREIFEEAIASVVTARDFGIIFNAYMSFEETIIEKDAEYTDTDHQFEDQLDKLIDASLNTIEERKDEEQLSALDREMINEQDEEDYKFFKLQSLLDRRPFLLSNTNLRQNPSNVYEWLNRVKLCEPNNDLKAETYLEAIFHIDPMNAYGKASKVWIEFANFYEENGDLKNANEIYKRAIKISYKSVDELASIYCAWAEMQFKHKNYESALLILHNACGSKKEQGNNRREREDCLHLSGKLWYFYADLQESIGTFEDTKTVYERMMDLKVASPQTVLNYCAYLEKHYYFEQAFRVYERALGVFQWPHCYDLWVIYLSKFIERYADEKVERTRDMFEQVLSKCPKDHKNRIFYYMYADFEENFGLINHASEIYDRASKEIPTEDQMEIFNVYIAKTAEYYGVTKTRSIYERAMEVLAGKDYIEMGLKFSKLERKLGEIDRARSIYQHMSQFCNPQIKEVQDKFWNVWEKFEIYHGNEDTYKEFMKFKRTVEMRYSIAAPTASS